MSWSLLYWEKAEDAPSFNNASLLSSTRTSLKTWILENFKNGLGNKVELCQKLHLVEFAGRSMEYEVCGHPDLNKIQFGSQSKLCFIATFSASLRGSSFSAAIIVAAQRKRTLKCYIRDSGREMY